MRVLAIALCALQAVSSERDEHGMRQALRLARMRAPRERRGPGAGRAQGRTGGMRDFYGGANRTRLWPRTKHLQPLLPTVPTEHLWAGGCCGLGHRTSRLMRLYVYAVSRGRHVVADWGACVGTPVANLFSALFGDWNELRAVKPRENQLRTPGCPSGVCPTGNKFKEAAKSRRSFFPNEPPDDWQPPGTRVESKHPSKTLWQGEWGLFNLHADIFRYAEHFAASIVKACVEINHFVGCTVRNRHRHAIEQASRRWREGRRDDSERAAKF